MSFVMLPTMHHKGNENAPWWIDAKRIAGELETMGVQAFCETYRNEFGDDILADIVNAWIETPYSFDAYFLMEVANILYGINLKLDSFFVDGSWQDVVYDRDNITLEEIRGEMERGLS